MLNGPLARPLSSKSMFPDKCAGTGSSFSVAGKALRGSGGPDRRGVKGLGFRDQGKTAVICKKVKGLAVYLRTLLHYETVLSLGFEGKCDFRC